MIFEYVSFAALTGFCNGKEKSQQMLKDVETEIVKRMLKTLEN